MNSMINPEILVSTGFCTEHKVQHITMGKFTGCPKCAIEYVKASEKQHAHEVQKVARDNHFAGAMIPVRHQNAGFQNYRKDHDGQTNAHNLTTSYTKEILKGAVKNLVMVGRTGTGKTHLSCATARTLLNKGMYARYITSENLSQDIMAAWSRTDDNERNTIARYTEYDLLILDEYGLHDRDKRLEPVHKVLYSRYDAGKATMLISNMNLESLKTDLGDRLWSRFQQNGLTIVECNWADARVSL